MRGIIERSEDYGRGDGVGTQRDEKAGKPSAGPVGGLAVSGLLPTLKRHPFRAKLRLSQGDLREPDAQDWRPKPKPVNRPPHSH